jgi:hypothetical protein
MAGKRFLNPYLKIMLCSAGMIVMGYFLYTSVWNGATYDHLTIARALVFLGFTYLLVQALRELLANSDK